MNGSQRRSRRVQCGPRAVALLTIALGLAAPLAGQKLENHVSLIGGMWSGQQFAQRSTTIQDPFVGAVELGSALDEGDAAVLGLQYTGFLAPWFAAEVTIAHVSNTWTTRGGNLQNGIVTGQIVDIGGVSTLPMSLNALVRVPGLGAVGPFLTGGIGGVYYEVNRANAPLRVTPAGGAPLDTLLFDLDMGFRPSINGGAGLIYRVSRFAVRGEARMWRTFIKETIADETLTHTNYWIALGAGLVF